MVLSSLEKWVGDMWGTDDGMGTFQEHYGNFKERWGTQRLGLGVTKEGVKIQAKYSFANMRYPYFG